MSARVEIAFLIFLIVGCIVLIWLEFRRLDEKPMDYLGDPTDRGLLP